MSLSTMSKENSPGVISDDEESVDIDFSCGVEDSSSEDWGDPKPKAARRDTQGYYNARVQELKKELDYSSVQVKPWNSFDYNNPNDHQTAETEGKLFTDAVSFVVNSEESESVINKNVCPAMTFNYHGGPDGVHGIDPMMNQDNSIILANCRSVENEENYVFKTNENDSKVQIELIEGDQCYFPVLQGSEQQDSVDEDQNEADGRRRECGGMRCCYKETCDGSDTSFKGCNGEFYARLKRLEQYQRLQTRCKKRNLKKIWKQFDLVQSKSDKVIQTLLRKVDMVEHAIENSYTLYDAEFFKLRRRVEQLEAENGILKERLKISNMLSFIRDNTRSLSSEHSGEVLDHRKAHSLCISPPCQQKMNSDELPRDDASVIYLQGSVEEDDNRPSTASKLASKLPKPDTKKVQDNDQGTDSGDDSHDDQGTDSSDDSLNDQNHGSQDNREPSGQAFKPFAKLKNKLKIGNMFLRKEDKKEDYKQEDYRKEDNEPEDQKHEVRKREDRTHEGRKHEDQNHEGRKREDRTHEGRKHEDRKHEGRKHENRKHEGRKQEVRKREGRKHENRDRQDRRQGDHKHEDLELEDCQNVNSKHDVCDHKNCQQENCTRKNENECSDQDEVDVNSLGKPKANYLNFTRVGLLKNWMGPLNGSSLQ